MPHEDIIHLDKSVEDYWNRRYDEVINKNAKKMDKKLTHGLNIIEAKRKSLQ